MGDRDGRVGTSVKLASVQMPRQPAPIERLCLKKKKVLKLFVGRLQRKTAQQLTALLLLLKT